MCQPFLSEAPNTVIFIILENRDKSWWGMLIKINPGEIYMLSIFFYIKVFQHEKSKKQGQDS